MLLCANAALEENKQKINELNVFPAPDVLSGKVFGSGGSAKATGTIKAKDKTTPPAVSSQPVSAEVPEDGSAAFTVTASGTTPLLCQWQVDKNDGAGWTDISGAVNASYTAEKVTAEQSGWKYRCVIKNTAGSVESNAAKSASWNKIRSAN